MGMAPYQEKREEQHANRCLASCVLLDIRTMSGAIPGISKTLTAVYTRSCSRLSVSGKYGRIYRKSTPRIQPGAA